MNYLLEGKMKKFLSMLLVATMAVGLAACGGGQQSSDAGNVAQVQGNDNSGAAVSLDVIISQYGTNTQEWWTQFEKDFEDANSDIDLNIEIVSWNDLHTVVTSRVSNNDAPDILNIDTYAEFVADDLLLPVEDYVSPETIAKFYPAFLEGNTIDGTIYATPILASARALFYNKDILDEVGVEPPKTWEDVKTVSKKILDYYDGDIYPWGLDLTTDEGCAAFSYYCWNNGGGWVDADGKWAMNSPENIEAVEYAVSLSTEGYTNTDPAQENRYALQDMFGQGKIAMMIGPNNIPTYITGDKAECPINYGVASLPVNGDREPVALGVYDRLFAFDNGYSDEELAAVTKFFDAFFDDETYTDYMMFEGFLPATQSGADYLAKQDSVWATWADILASANFYPSEKAEYQDAKVGSINVLQAVLLGGNAKEELDALQEDLKDASGE